MDLPAPVVCQMTPARLSPRAAVIVEPTALVTAKYWCGFAMRMTSPSAVSSNAVKSL